MIGGVLARFVLHAAEHAADLDVPPHGRLLSHSNNHNHNHKHTNDDNDNDETHQQT